MAKLLVVALCMALAVANAKPQLDLLKKAAESVTGVFDGCKGKESSFATKPGDIFYPQPQLNKLLYLSAFKQNFSR